MNSILLQPQSGKRLRPHSTLLAATICALAPLSSFGAFGLTSSGGYYTVDSGAGLVFMVNQSDGDITSIKFNGGPELQDQSKGSHISSGLGTGTSVVGTNSNGIITISLTNSPVTHYLVVKSGVNNIYMATYISAEPSVGELRWITRIQSAQLPNVITNSNIQNGTVIESSDVFQVGSETRSKYYGNQQAQNLTIRGATGTNVGIFMAYGNRESSSGGPFYRDIQNQTSGDTEIYNYMNSGHNQPEAWRTGLFGPYALCFTTGTTPSVPDMSFMSTLGLTGYVDSTGRGRVVLNGIAGRDTSYTYTVALSNTTAQYWVTASASNGSCELYNVKAGTYTMTIYKGELAVDTRSATVVAGSPTTFNTITVTGDPSTTATIWRIGDWDGTPLEFLNGGNLYQWHPSDARNAAWGPVTYTVGTSSTGSFPAVEFRGDNSPVTINFTLTAAQVAAHTMKIGITDAYNSGRPSVTINGHALTNPGASTQPNSRSFTTGSYRGNNTTFTYSIPAGDFVTGANSLTITPISGSADSGAWLSASYSFDCVELDN